MTRIVGVPLTRAAYGHPEEQGGGAPMMTSADTHSADAAIIEPNQTAFILKVTRPDEAEVSGQLMMFYVAITTSESEALTVVRRVVKADAIVEPTGVRLSQQTASALNLEAGLARAL
jgi:hypothetical protein